MAHDHHDEKHTHEKHQGCSHDHGHEGHHHHGHGHSHAHVPSNIGAAFLIGISLNVFFVCVEAVMGIKSNSLALLADAGHNASDVIGLFLAWGASHLAKQKPSPRFTYGYHNSSILAALTNAFFLLFATGGIAWEASHRFFAPEEVASGTVMLVAALGVAVNAASASLFIRASKEDLNVRSAFLHLVADALVSLGVVLSGGLMMWTGWMWLDPAMGVLVSLIILFSTFGVLKESLAMSLHAVPAQIDSFTVKAFLGTQEGVTEVHDLHIWAIGTTQNALSVHLIIPQGHPGDAFIQRVAKELLEKFSIHHSTIQIELGDSGQSCPLAPDDVI